MMRLYVAYASDELPRAEQIIRALESEGHTVLRPSETLKAGQNLDEQIKKAVRESDRTLLLLSRLGGSHMPLLVNLIVNEVPDLGAKVIVVKLDDTVSAPPALAACKSHSLALQPLGNLTGISSQLGLSGPAPRPAPPQRPSKRQATSPPPVVVLVHGIRTTALWEHEIKIELNDAGFEVWATSYGRYGAADFVRRNQQSEARAIDRIRGAIESGQLDYRETYNCPAPPPSIIAHSFGTFLACQMIRQRHAIDWGRLILCGSVLPDDYPLDQLQRQVHRHIINEVGSRDYWPAIAQKYVQGMGSAGSTGICHPIVDTRWHTGVDHYGYLNRGFCQKFWVPVLKDSVIARGDPPSELPWFIERLASRPFRDILLLTRKR
jgi:hypothetical protein